MTLTTLYRKLGSHAIFVLFLFLARNGLTIICAVLSVREATSCRLFIQGARVIQGDTGLPGTVGTKGQKGEKGGIGMPGRRVSKNSILLLNGDPLRATSERVSESKCAESTCIDFNPKF